MQYAKYMTPFSCEDSYQRRNIRVISVSSRESFKLDIFYATSLKGHNFQREKEILHINPHIDNTMARNVFGYSYHGYT